MKSSGPTASPAADVIATLADEADSEIEETDIRILRFYGDGDEDAQTLVGLGEDYGYPRVPPLELGDDNGQTLVGLGPPSSRSPVSLANTQPGRALPRSEPPGPWGSDEDQPSSLWPRKTGIWAAAVPLLLVAAAVVVIALRGLAPSKPQSVVPALSGMDLAAREGTGLFVHLTNPELRVSLDGIDQGPPPVLLMDLDPGSHVLVVSGPGYVRYEQPLTLIANHVSTIELVLERSTPSVDAPPTAEGQSPESTSEEREHPRPRYGVPLSGRSARALFGSVKPLPVELDETPENPYLPSSLGVLTASSSPPATVVVDGRPVGKSPRVLDLAAGTHTIAFVHPTRGRKSMTVKIAPGNTTNVAVDF